MPIDTRDWYRDRWGRVPKRLSPDELGDPVRGAPPPRRGGGLRRALRDNGSWVLGLAHLYFMLLGLGAFVGLSGWLG